MKNHFLLSPSFGTAFFALKFVDIDYEYYHPFNGQYWKNSAWCEYYVIVTDSLGQTATSNTVSFADTLD